MTSQTRSSLVLSCAVLAVVLADARAVAASWLTIKNETQQIVVVQETMVVNGRLKRCKPVSLLPGETLREFLPGPTTKKVEVLDGHNPKRSLWSGRLHQKDESQTFSIRVINGNCMVTPMTKPKTRK